jgi:hypothetical protein
MAATDPTGDIWDESAKPPFDRVALYKALFGRTGNPMPLEIPPSIGNPGQDMALKRLLEMYRQKVSSR